VTPLDSPGPKIEGRCKQHAIASYGDRVIPPWTLIGCNAKWLDGCYGNRSH